MGKPLRSIPWYDKYQEYFNDAFMSIIALTKFGKLEKDSIINFEKETLARFIFESNNIEREGLPFGETKELIFIKFDEYDLVDEMKKHDFWLNTFLNESLHAELDIKVFDTKDIYKSKPDRNENALTMLANYGSKSKNAYTVVNHYIASKEADIHVTKYMSRRNHRRLYDYMEREIKSGKPKQKKDLIKAFDDFFPNGKKPRRKYLLTENVIKNFHKMMARDLMSDNESPPGEYRKKSIMTDFDSHYPAPEAVPNAMKLFIKQFQEKANMKINPISLAAWASTQFVLIHPFSDFNGRMSRLIINMVLRSNGVPFWVSLRSTNKEKKRYITALRHYRRGKWKSISALISMQILNNFHNFNSVLDLINYPKLVIKEPPWISDNLSNDDLNKLTLDFNITPK